MHRLAQLADAMPALVSVVDRGFVYRFVNRSYSEWFGEPREKIVGRHMRDVLGDATFAIIEPRLLAAFAGDTVSYEAELPYKHGGARYVLGTYSPDRAEDGTVRGAFVFVHDITDRRRAELALAASEREFRAMFELAATGMAQADPTTRRFLRVNRRFCQITGFSEEELLERTYGDITHPEDRGRDLALTDPVRRGENDTWEIEKRYLRKDGQVAWVHVSGRLVRDAAGRPHRTVASIRDITAQKQAERALQEAARRKDEFLATLAHELRNPLSPVRTGVALLRARGAGDPALRRPLEIIDRQVGHMARLLDDLLDVSRITRNKLELRRERVTLDAVLQSALETSRPHIDAAAHTVSVTLPPEPIELHADPIRLAQVFSNLLNNSAKYTERGGRIAIHAWREGSSVVVSVKDTGIGIAPEALPHVFEMFSQASPALDRAQGGLGIGLSLVRALVELHGGRIEARSEGAGRGTEMVTRLPVLGRSTGAGADAGAREAGARGAPGFRIVVADDLPDNAETLAMLLEHAGHEVHTVHDGEAAVAAADRLRPDVLFLDIGMPRLNGYEAARRIRSEPWGAGMVLIAATGWGQKEDQERARLAGFDFHLTKPIQPATLLDLLGRLPTGAGGSPA